MTTKELIGQIFKEPGIQFELSEFENLGKPIHDILSIYPRVSTTGKDAGKTKYYLTSFIPFSTGNEELQVYVEGGKSAPEEIVRQLWVYKLINQYGYKVDELDLEKGVQFGTEVGTKAADIIVYTLDHEIGQVQFNRWVTGSTNRHLSPRDVARVLVPRLVERSEAKIADAVRESLSMRQESEQLLAISRSHTEELIEQAAQK